MSALPTYTQLMVWRLRNLCFKGDASSTVWAACLRETIRRLITTLDMRPPPDVIAALDVPWQDWGVRSQIKANLERAFIGHFRIPAHTPVSLGDPGSVGWPRILIVGDLNADPFTPCLRPDVDEWLRRAFWPHLSAISYDHHDSRPILLLVPDAASLEKCDLILRNYTGGDAHCIPPTELIRIQAVGRYKAVYSHESCSINSGTVGGWIKIGDERYGITCGHVARPGSEHIRSYEVICSRKDGSCDLAVVRPIDCPNGNGVCSSFRSAPKNPLLFRPLSELDASRLRRGERVVKCGAVTGYTEGTLLHLALSLDMSGQKYRGAYGVLWDSPIPFAMPGDCGALYCVKTKQGYLPFAIHVNTTTEEGTDGEERRLSIGLPLSCDALEALLGVGDGAWVFDVHGAAGHYFEVAERILKTTDV